MLVILKSEFGGDLIVFVALETRENIPLQKGRKNAGLCSCSEDYLSGFKFINIAFGSLTVIITAALLVQIYYGDYQVGTL